MWGDLVLPAGQVGQKAQRPPFEQVRSVLRTCFAHWNTLPDRVQTDGEPVLIGKPQGTFPSLFALWLKGLGIDHIVIRPGKPTDNAEVERCHRTINDYAVVGHEDADMAQLQHILDQAVYKHNEPKLVSRLGPKWICILGYAVNGSVVTIPERYRSASEAATYGHKPINLRNGITR